jgi:hypothetical protein
VARDVSIVVRYDPDMPALQTDPDQSDAHLATKAKPNATSVVSVGLFTEFGCGFNVEEGPFR